MRIDGLAWVMLLGLSLIWGGSFFFFAVLTALEPALTVVFWRVSLAAAALFLLALVLRLPVPRDRRFWAAALVMGALNNALPFSLIAWAQARGVEAGLAAIFNATTPIFTLIVAHGLTSDEKITPARAAGVMLGFLGVVIIMAPGLGAATLDAAPFAILGAAVSYAFASVWGRRFKGVARPVTAAAMLSGASLIMLPLMLVVDGVPDLSPGAGYWPATLGLALMSTALAYILYFSILERAGAANLMLVTVLAAPVAALLGAVFLDQVLPPRAWPGLGVIALGLLLIDGRVLAPWRRIR